MLLILIYLVILLLFLCAYIKWCTVKGYWAKKGVPFRPPHPLLGSLTFLQTENTGLWMRRLYREFKAPYVGIWLLWRPALVINDPEIAKKVLVKDSDNFRNRYLGSGKSDPTGALNLFTVNDPIWTRIRRRLTAVFTAAKLRSHNGITKTKSQDLVQRIREEVKKGNIFNLRMVCTDYSTDVIGESAFGITSESTKTGDSVMRKVTREFMAFDLQRGLSWSCIFFFPELVDIFRLSFFPKHTIEFLRQVYRNIVEQRGGLDKEVKEPRDLLDSLLKMRQEALAENEEMSEDFILAQAAVFLLGGFDTSGATMSYLLYELAWHPQYQERLYQELKEAKEKKDDKDLDAATLSELTYLTAVIKEVLRLFPPMGWLDRIAANDYKIDDKLTISAGTAIYVNAVGMHVDPQYFPDPLVFNPDRFLPENERKIIPYTYMPFGDGPRGCIGKRFAYQTLRQGLSSIILEYEVRALPNSPKPNDIEVEKNGMFLMPMDERMAVQFIPREKI